MLRGRQPYPLQALLITIFYGLEFNSGNYLSKVSLPSSRFNLEMNKEFYTTANLAQSLSTLCSKLLQLITHPLERKKK